MRPEKFANQAEVKTLTAELAKASDQYKKEILKARSDHTTPPSCPPKDMDLQLDGLLAAAAGLPPRWQTREFTDSFREIMTERYPCPKESLSS